MKYTRAELDNVYFQLEKDNTIELLEEIGEINLMQFPDDYNFDILIQVLDEYYNLPCEIQHIVGGSYLVNEHFEENRRD